MVESSARPERPKKERSPSFPFISLQRAVDRVSIFERMYGRHATRVADAAKAWGFEPKSSTNLQTIAALKAFGLLQESGSGLDRKVGITDLARTILQDQRPGMREGAIRTAATKPKLIAEYLPNWGEHRPPDHHCVSELTMERGFSADAARAFVRVFDESIAFAGLSNPDSMAPSAGDVAKAEGENGSEEPEWAVGDLVQWSPNGILQFRHPRRIRAFSPDRRWAFVEGSETGLPMSEIEPATKRNGTEEELSAQVGGPPLLPEEKQIFQGRLPGDVEYRILAKGEFGPRQIGRLIRILQVQQEVLLEDEESEAHTARGGSSSN